MSDFINHNKVNIKRSIFVPPKEDKTFKYEKDEQIEEYEN